MPRILTSGATATDERLVALARSGSDRAFEEIMRRYRAPLHSYCRQMLGPSRAEDAVQQAFLQALIALRGGSDRPIALRPWLYRISRNCSIDILRRKGWDYDQLDPEYDGVAQPPRLVEQKHELEQLVVMMHGLPERQRRALTLRELEGRSYSEIASELGHSNAGVRQLIFRARSALRNAAAAIAFPFIEVRNRLATHASSFSDAHQAAFSASAGGDPVGLGFAKASAGLLAVLAVLTGGAATDQQRARHDRPAAVAMAATPHTVSAARVQSPRHVEAERRKPKHHTETARKTAESDQTTVAQAPGVPADVPISASASPQAATSPEPTTAAEPTAPKPRAARRVPKRDAGQGIEEPQDPDLGEVSPVAKPPTTKRVPKRPLNSPVPTRGSDPGQKTQKTGNPSSGKVLDPSKGTGQPRGPGPARR